MKTYRIAAKRPTSAAIAKSLRELEALFRPPKKQNPVGQGLGSGETADDRPLIREGVMRDE